MAKVALNGLDVISGTQKCSHMSSQNDRGRCRFFRKDSQPPFALYNLHCLFETILIFHIKTSHTLKFQLKSRQKVFSTDLLIICERLNLSSKKTCMETEK